MVRSALIVVATALIGGCASSATAPAPATAVDPAASNQPQPTTDEVVMARPRPSLVLPGPGAAPFEGECWVRYRNDAALGALRQPTQSYIEVTETLIRERLQITNGRPIEQTIFRTRTYRRQ